MNMNLTVQVVNGKLICLKQNHDEPVEMIMMDNQVPLYERLLCLKCFKAKRQVSKYISIEEAEELIEEKLYKFNNQQEEQQKRILYDLSEFQNKFMNIRSRILQQIDEILRISQQWMTSVTNIGRKSDVNNFIEELQFLQQDVNLDQEQFNKSNQSHLQKIYQCFKKLINIDDYLICNNILKNILNTRSQKQQDQPNNQNLDQLQNQQINQPNVSTDQNNNNKLKIKQVSLIQTVKQLEPSYAIAYNNSGSIMVTGFGQEVKSILKGHTNCVSCLVFSKYHNWFASGSCDCTIIFWQNLFKDYWISTKPENSHSNRVNCLILNNQEDQLISCSVDKKIMVWRVDCKENQIEYLYSLEMRHTDQVFCISLNESETALVSCGQDKRIILRSAQMNSRWKYQHELIMDDFGYRIGFISENQIIWQQNSIGITHLFEYKQGKLRKRPHLNIKFNQEFYDDCNYFPIIRNKAKQLIIEKYNRYIYILKLQANDHLQVVSNPIECCSDQIFGALTEDGEFLTIWNAETIEFQFFYIYYEDSQKIRCLSL